MAKLLNVLPRKVLVGAGVTALVAVAAIVMIGARHNRPMVSHPTISASSMLAEEAAR